MKWVSTLFWMAIFLLAILFSVQNRVPVTLRFGLYPLEREPWFEIPEVPLFLVILCGIFLGFLIGGFGDLYKRFQLKRTLRQNQKVIERLEREVDSLRSPAEEKPPLGKKEP